MRAKSGEVIWQSAILCRIEYQGRPALQVVSRDISERKRAEEALRESEARLRRAEKMEALGAMAGGVAHDLNNALGVMVGYSDLILQAIRPFLS